MKQINAFILSCLLACSGYSQSSIQKAEKMIAARQYKSAFSLLEKADPENQSPDIVILKTNILLDFFILSIHHELFALKDLEENETLLELRREADGDYEMIVFTPRHADPGGVPHREQSHRRRRGSSRRRQGSKSPARLELGHRIAP